jgi:hypothetical protein
MGDSRKYRLGQTVEVQRPAGTYIGRIVGHEPGENLGRRFGGPFPGTVYHVTVVPTEGLERRVIVPEAAVSRLADST